MGLSSLRGGGEVSLAAAPTSAWGSVQAAVQGGGGTQTPAVPPSLWVEETEIWVQWLEFVGRIPASMELLRGKEKEREHETKLWRSVEGPFSLCSAGCVAWGPPGWGKDHWEQWVRQFLKLRQCWGQSTSPPAGVERFLIPRAKPIPGRILDGVSP